MGASNLLGDDNGTFDLISIRNEIHDLCITEDGQIRLLTLYHDSMKQYALGCNKIYKEKVSVNDKVVMVKQRMFSHVIWAPAVKADGGGCTKYHPLETMCVINSCAVVVNNWLQLKCKPDLGFIHCANVGKAFRMYILIMYVLKLGFRFPKYVRSRTEESFIKKVKGMTKKKNPDPDAIKLRTIITTAPFDKVKNVSKTS